jgi:hypothetical protein
VVRVLKNLLTDADGPALINYANAPVQVEPQEASILDDMDRTLDQLQTRLATTENVPLIFQMRTLVRQVRGVIYRDQRARANERFRPVVLAT